MRARLMRRWHIWLLTRRGWPQPEATLDWLESRQLFFDRDGDHER